MTFMLHGDQCKPSVQLEILAPYEPSKTETQFDFRLTKWGMLKEQVIATEGRPANDAPDRLEYQTEVAGLRATMTFEFIDGKLVRAGYALTEKYRDLDQYVINGTRWIEPLKEKYGEPKSDFQWLNELYRHDQKQWSVAISKGQLVIRNSWETKSTTIQHIIAGKNFEISVTVYYTSKELGAALDGKVREAQKDVF